MKSYDGEVTWVHHETEVTIIDDSGEVVRIPKQAILQIAKEIKEG